MAEVTYATQEQSEALRKAQWAASKGSQPLIECGCGVVRAIRWMFRCYYCNIFFCQECAPVHFGQTRDDYYASRRAILEGGVDGPVKISSETTP